MSASSLRSCRERADAIDAFIAERVKAAQADPELAAVLSQDLRLHQVPIAPLVERFGGLPVFAPNDVDLLANYAEPIDRLVSDVYLLYYMLHEAEEGQGQ